MRKEDINLYSEQKNIQLLVSLLKQYNICDIVISPGSRHVGFVYLVENDDFFNTYSIVDERSAGFFAIGLMQKTGKAAVVCCTSGTAACNYVSAVTEAFYRNLPLIVVTADKEEHLLKKREDQLIAQTKLYEGICKKIVTLPIIKERKDCEYCNLLINEALISSRYHGNGPVHINFYMDTFKTNKAEKVPEARKIDFCRDGDFQAIEDMVGEMQRKKVLLLYGHALPLTLEEKEIIREFGKLFDCVIATEKESNLHEECCVETYNIMSFIREDDWIKVKPDIVITSYGLHFNYPIKHKLMESTGYKHWHISEKGEMVDSFDCLEKVIEMPPKAFFTQCVKAAQCKEIITDENYLKVWKKIQSNCEFCELPYSISYVVQELFRAIPDKSELHVGNGVISSHIQPFAIKEDVLVFRNEATTGIDGCMSTFIGQSQLCEELSFLLIGDLSFFMI